LAALKSIYRAGCEWA